jgi:hypothetical protein
MTPQPSSSCLKGVRTKSEQAKMGKKKTHEKNRTTLIKPLINQNKKNHENDKIKKNKTWVLFLPLNLAFKHHSLALHILNIPQLAIPQFEHSIA